MNALSIISGNFNGDYYIIVLLSRTLRQNMLTKIVQPSRLNLNVGEAGHVHIVGRFNLIRFVAKFAEMAEFIHNQSSGQYVYQYCISA